MIALIDADILVYQCAYAVESGIDWGDGEYTLTADADQAKRDVDAKVASLLEFTGANRAVACLSDAHENFRKDVLPSYKETRNNTLKASRKPLVYRVLRDHFRANFECFQRPRLEADDIMGILATGDIKAFSGERVICSIDKDMLTIPGLHFNWSQSDKGIVTQTLGAADHMFMLQTLMGDSTDNYKGCPGLGPKRAARLFEASGMVFDECENVIEGLWPIVLKAFKDDDEALVQARCARILRADDYNFKKKEPILWTPPKL